MNNYLVGDFVRAKRESMGLSLREFGDLCQISHTTIDIIEKGYDPRTRKAVNITNGTFGKLAKGMNVPVYRLVELSEGIDGGSEKSYNSSSRGIKIPVLGSIQAGIPIEAVEDILDYEEITPELAETGEFFALRVKGRSMEPRIMEGDVVIVRCQDDAENGDIVVALVNGNEATVKRLKKQDNGIMLFPNNPEFEPMFYSCREIDELPVRIQGKVVELRGKL